MKINFHLVLGLPGFSSALFPDHIMRKISDEKAKKYSRLKTRALILDIVLTVSAMIIFQIFLSEKLNGVLVEQGLNFYVNCLIFYACFFVFLFIIGFPVKLNNSYLIEHKFSLSRQSLKQWLMDEAKSLLLSFILTVICVVFFYFILRSFPGTWWVISGIAWILFTVLMARIFPVFVIPFFYEYSSLDDVNLKNDILDLSKRYGIDLIDVCKIDLGKKSTKANAALVGLGKTRKVILADTLIEKFSADEIKAVVAHEFGHLKYKHMPKLLIFNGMITITGFYILYLFSDKLLFVTSAEGLYDLYLMPVFFLILTLSGVLFMPLQNFFSRVLEKQADKFSLEAVAPGSFIRAMNKLAEQNLAEVQPSFFKKVFLYSHPPIRERIMMAEKYRERYDSKKQ